MNIIDQINELSTVQLNSMEGPLISKREVLAILSEQKEPLTIGDKIRESNESLADEINNLINKCHICSCQYNPRECHKNPCSTGILDYLNQPYTETH